MRPPLLERLRAALADRYAIEREVGRGGMSIVYLAADVKHSREVAIKILKPELAALVGPERFIREIEIAAGLAHPHILPLHDSGEADGFLYYVMPYVEGESLQGRLARQGALPLAEALRVTREVADALDYAHARGIVHRDIKPANILFQAQHAVVSDFGIARAVSEAAGESLTESGLAVGTPGYTSPEQALGERDVDARSDVYSLGCVLYEMLAGEPPYTGSSPQAILGHQITKSPPSIQRRAPTVPRRVDTTIRRALAKEPDDRYPTAAAFVDALGTPAEVAPTLLGRALRGLRSQAAAIVLGGALAGLALATALWIGLGPAAGGAGTAAPVDTSRYAIFPFEYVGTGAQVYEVQRLQDALLRWTGVSVADPFQLGELLAQADTGPLTHSRAVELARQVGAGRYLRGSISQVGDSLWVRAGVYDAVAAGSLLAEHTVRLPPDLEGADSAFAALADRLLLPGIRLADGSAAETRSLPARQAFARGQKALQTWDLAAADTAFTGAARLDPDYAQAHLWQALVRAWRGADPARWRLAAQQAVQRRESLSARDRTMADAVLAEAREDLGRACPIWRRLTETQPQDFAAWFGRANCQSKDIAVVRDTASPSGWSFRTSQHNTLRAYRRAFELHPAILSAYRGGSFERLRSLLFASGSARRRGRAVPPDTTIFTADPAWQGDSLAFVPYPRHAAQRRLTSEAAALAEAVRRQRLQFREIALAWVAAFPASADAMEALAISMAMLGEPSALDTLQRARKLVREPDERLRVAGAEVWMGVAFAIPAEHDRLRGARQLADSLLDEHPPGGGAEPLVLAGLAALTGHAHRAAAYMRDPGAAEKLQTPRALRPAGPVLLIYSALGGPMDSLAVWEARLRSAMKRSMVPLERRDTAQWLLWPATLAFPTYRFQSFDRLTRTGDYLLELQATWAAGDTAAVERGLSAVREVRRGLDPATLSMDALYPEAWLLAALGDPQGAADWLDPTLNALPQTAPNVLVYSVRAATLVRAMALRARLAARLGDPDGAAAWARAVTILWSDADPFLQPMVKELRRLTD